MNLEELRSVQNGERRKSGLQSLRESFYEEAGEYVGSLKQRRDRAAERADDPFSDPEVRELSDEIETAEEVIEAIYERRMGKLLKRASLAAAEMSADEEGLTAEERELFHDLVERIRENKTNVLDTVAGEDEEGRPSDAGAERTDPPERGDPDPEPASTSDVSVADAMGGGTVGTGDESPAESGAGDGQSPARHEVEPEPAPPGAPDPDRSQRESTGSSPTANDPAGTGEDRVTLRITADVGEIYGVDDREYELVSEDVVQLPERNAQPLVQRDAAERLD